jgi:hypothetical protein
MSTNRARIARGAAAGAVAAGVWAAQQPLDMRVFDVDYDDVALLGTFVTRGPAAQPVGLVIHLANGAAFGAGYAALAPRSSSIPGWARGAAVGLAEHLASWPLTAVVARTHPGRDELPVLWGSGRAFAQATWRHLLFGAVLGALEARLNAVSAAPPPPVPDQRVAATNGHGNLEHALSAPPAS